MLVNATPLFLVVLVLGILAILFGPRRRVLLVFLAISIFVSFGPRIVLFEQNFMIHRVLLLFAWVRVLVRGEYRGLASHRLDRAFIWFCLWTLVGDTLLWGTMGAAVFQLANSVYDALGIYFLSRVMLKDSEDVWRLLTGLVWISVVLAAFMSLEFVTGRSWLDALGAFNENVQVRAGRLRCQAAFGVPITAGTFGAVLMPVFVACWWQGGKWRKRAIAGCVASTIITLTSGSGGPVMTYAAGVGGLLAWWVRRRMRMVRWGMVLSVLGLALLMNAPVWYLIARIDVVPGASSHHRAKIIDGFVRHMDEWWALGVQSTGHWGWEMEDVANQYLVVAKHGGILALLLFLRMLAVGFGEVGRLRRRAGSDSKTEILMWGIGVMFFTHAVSFMGISYFDQMKVFWFVSLALIASSHLLVAREVQRAGVSAAHAVHWAPGAIGTRLRPA